MLTSIHTDKAPAAIGPYSQAIVMNAAQKLIFVSGQLPIDPTTGKLVDGGIEAMTRCILHNIQAILEAAGSSLEHVVRVEIFCKELKRDFAAINQEYAFFFKGSVKPARQTIEVAALPMDSPLEISCIAVVP